MVTETESTPKPLSDNELLLGLEALARRRWEEQWSSGMNVLTTLAHCDLVPGETEFDGRHRIIVRYMPTARFEYFYRECVFQLPSPIGDRDDALYAIGCFRPESERDRLPAFMANDQALELAVRS